MIDKATKLLLTGTALLGLSVGSAHAYLPEGKTFRERAGSAASLAMADVASDPAAQALKILLGVADKKEPFLEKRDRAAMVEFYAERDYQPVWTVNGKLTAQATKIMARITAAAEDGLDPAAYHLPPDSIGAKAPAGPEIVAAVEATLSRAILTYARQAYAGRMDPASLGPNVTAKPILPDPIDVLAKVSVAPDGAVAIGDYNPQQPGYVALKKALAGARIETTGSIAAPIPPGKALKLGVVDERVPLLRARLDVAPPAGNPNLFDPDLAVAVKAFQADKGLTADGSAGAGTIAALNGPARPRTADILANMERWRWLPRDLGAFHIEVNIPEFMVRIVENDQVIHETKVVTGKVTNQTPIFSDEMESIVVNPTWNIPASITMKEVMPAVRKDPYYLQRQGYQVLANVGGKFRAVDPTMIDWSTVNPKQIQIKQPPGDDNALGNIKFLFPNEHDVYLHDTPSKSFFNRDVRALSHGCVRVQNPLDFADVILAHEGGWSGERLRRMIGGPESWITLPKHIPIHLTYFTAFVDQDGQLQIRPDIYGYDARIEKALGV